LISERKAEVLQFCEVSKPSRKRTPVITDPIQINQCFVKLPDVRVLGVEDRKGGPFRCHVELPRTILGCPECGVLAHVKDRDVVELVDLPLYGHPTRLVWHKRRLHCQESECPKGSWTEQDPRIATMNLQMTDRCGRWMTEQVGRGGRPVSDVANDLGCDWHTVNDAVLSYGEALLADPGRFGDVNYLGLDETAFLRQAPYYRTQFTTSIVDVGNGQLLDVVPGRKAEEPTTWLKKQGDAWLAHVVAGALDLSGPYRKVFNDTVPHATLVADPFHVIKVANSKLDECRRRVQSEQLGHRGRKDDPLYRIRRLLTKAHERVDEKGHEKMRGLLLAGDPRGEVADCYTAKEAVRELYSFVDHELALTWIDELIRDMKNSTWPLEVRSLGRTLKNWRAEIIAWHKIQISNGPTEGAILWSGQNRVHDVAYR
jgi:transposase